MSSTFDEGYERPQSGDLSKCLSEERNGVVPDSTTFDDCWVLP